MHRAFSVFAIVLLLLSAAPALTAGAKPDLATAAETAFLDLKKQAQSDVEPSDGSPSERAARQVFAASRVPTADALAAWRAAENATAEDARDRVLAAEVALLRVATQNVLAAHEAGDDEATRGWLGVALTRVDAAAREIPLPETDAPLEAEALAETLHATLAVRARELAVEAVMLQRAGEPAAAAASARAAEALGGLLVGDASARLTDGMREAFEGNATRVAEIVADLPEERKEHPLRGFFAPLVALEYDRIIEPLDELAQRNVDRAYVVARAAVEEPDLLSTLAEEAFLQYGADRAGLFLKGEGTMDEADVAYERLRGFALDGDTPATLEATHAVHRELRKVGLLERGIVLKVETGGVQPNRTHAYKVTLVRPPLEGLRAYNLTITYDPAIIRITGAAPLLGDRFDHAATEGRITLGAVFEAPLRESAHVAKLHLEAVGPGESKTNLTVEEARFMEADGDGTEVFRLRHGSATVAVFAVKDDPVVPDEGGIAVQEETEPARGAPFPTPAALVALAGIAAAASPRRR